MAIQKKICCIVATDVKHEAKVLLDEIQSRIHLTIPILDENNSVVDYEVVIFILSEGAKQEESVNTLLKEASDLNKIFLPVIIGGSWWKNWLLKHTFKSVDFHSSYYALNKTKHMLNFYSQLMSLSGATVIGDPFGRVFTFSSDQDCQLLRNHEVIAELTSGKVQDVTLYLGIHKIKIKCKFIDCNKDINLSVDSLESSEKTIITTKFLPDIKIKASIDCSILENQENITDVNSEEEVIIHLLPGTHKLKFQHPLHKNLNRYITIRVKPDEDKSIVYNFPHSPREFSDN